MFFVHRYENQVKIIFYECRDWVMNPMSCKMLGTQLIVQFNLTGIYMHDIEAMKNQYKLIFRGN